MIDDTRLTLLTFDHYRLAQPLLYKAMSKHGTLWDTIDEKVAHCRSQIAALTQQGMTEIEAANYVIESEINQHG